MEMCNAIAATVAKLILKLLICMIPPSLDRSSGYDAANCRCQVCVKQHPTSEEDGLSGNVGFKNRSFSWRKDCKPCDINILKRLR